MRSRKFRFARWNRSPDLILDGMNTSDMSRNHKALLESFRQFVLDEHHANQHKMTEIWNKPLGEKLISGLSQGFSNIERGPEPGTLWAYLDDTESRYREGDMLRLHTGSATDDVLGGEFTLEYEDEDRWLLRGNQAMFALDRCKDGTCYADPDSIDLTEHYLSALTEIAKSPSERNFLLPLLCGEIEPSFNETEYTDAEQIARAEGYNEKQIEAVAYAFSAEHVFCIQGPPGTGKTRVLSLLTRLMVDRGESILMTSHTHMAINNALNKIKAQGVPAAKIGKKIHRKGLDDSVEIVESLQAWGKRPKGGYVVGATPFAANSEKMKNHRFDVVIFDEASQVTVPLALMAMRKGSRFIFIGDQKQLPPVMLSRSVLAADEISVFSRLIGASTDPDRVTMLSETYRMNRWLTEWPSRTFYGNELTSAGANRERLLKLSPPPSSYGNVFAPEQCAVFIPARDPKSRTCSRKDAELVAALCAVAVKGGLNSLIASPNGIMRLLCGLSGVCSMHPMNAP